MRLVFIDIFRKLSRNHPRKNDITYNKTSLHEALEIVENGMSIQKAAKQKLITRETLRRCVTNPPSKHGRGKRPVLMLVEEEIIVVALEQCSASAGHVVVKKLQK